MLNYRLKRRIFLLSFAPCPIRENGDTMQIFRRVCLHERAKELSAVRPPRAIFTLLTYLLWWTQATVCVLSHIWLFATSWITVLQILCPCDFCGKNTGVGCHFLLQGIFPTQGLNLCLLYLLHWQAGSVPFVPPHPMYQRDFFLSKSDLCQLCFIYVQV